MAQFRRAAGAFVVLLTTALAGAHGARAASAPIRCVGDCDRDRTISIAELVTGVDVALGRRGIDACSALDCDASGSATVDCVVRAVKTAIEGCGQPDVAMPTVEAATGGAGLFIIAAGFNLADVGYTQSEFFFSGTATSYANVGELPGDGKWVAEPATTTPYKSRMVVYRPIDPADFNGTVIVEWLNVSGGLDTGPDWIAAHTEMTRDGFAWVGVSAQKLGIEGGTSVTGLPTLSLKQHDPARYGSLSHPGDSFSYDIFSQAGQAVRAGQGVNAVDPLGGLTPRRVIAAGESQSAFRMVTYIDAIHPLVDLYDGFLVHSRGGSAAPLSEAPQVSIGVPNPAFIRDDVNVPVFVFQTETDLTFLQYFPARQPDSPRLRVWEVAGTSHADAYTLSGLGDKGGSPDSAKLQLTKGIGCSSFVNAGPQHFVLNAAVAALDAWVRNDTLPPIGDPLDVSAGPPVAIVRDADGNALGGIRTPQVDAPIAMFSGDPQEGSLLCDLFGSTMPFDDAKLASLYADHDAYVAAVEASADQAVGAGFLLAPDAELIKAAAAAESDIP